MLVFMSLPLQLEKGAMANSSMFTEKTYTLKLPIAVWPVQIFLLQPFHVMGTP